MAASTITNSPVAVGLAIQHARQQHAGFGHDGPARLDQDLKPMPGHALRTWPG